MEAVNRVKNKERRFEEFRKSHIYQTQRIYGSLKELRKDPPTADLYITGSDQVWHPVLLRRKDDRAYWLDFGSDRIRRIAYAASFGSDQCPLRLQAVRYPVRTRGKRGRYLPSGRERGGTCARSDLVACEGGVSVSFTRYTPKPFSLHFYI